MRVLLIHHFETMWERGLKLFGYTFQQVGEMLLEHLGSHSYDRVILTRFDSNHLEDEHFDLGIDQYVDSVYEYAYGWEPSMFDPEEEGEKWVKGGFHSEAVYLADFLHELAYSNANVDLCGAFDGECIEDMEIALTALSIPFNRLNHLIVG